MDIFDSALKNPVPPLPKKEEEKVITNNGGQRRRNNSRRKHRNSHLGCGTCKKRRIKCDENLPSCFNCLKGKLHCAYLNLDGGAQNALRVAQYNQNIRQDKSEEKKHASQTHSGVNSDGSSSSVPPAEQFNRKSPLFAAPYPVVQTASPITLPPGPCMTHYPYGPAISIQPVQAMGPQIVSYPQVPVVQHQVSMMYPNSQLYQPMPVNEVPLPPLNASRTLTFLHSSQPLGSLPPSLRATPNITNRNEFSASIPSLNSGKSLNRLAGTDDNIMVSLLCSSTKKRNEEIEKLEKIPTISKLIS